MLRLSRRSDQGAQGPAAATGAWGIGKDRGRIGGGSRMAGRFRVGRASVMQRQRETTAEDARERRRHDLSARSPRHRLRDTPSCSSSYPLHRPRPNRLPGIQLRTQARRPSVPACFASIVASSSFSAPLRLSRPCLHTPQASRSTASSSTLPRPVPHHLSRTTNGVTLRTPWRPTTNEMR